MGIRLRTFLWVILFTALAQSCKKNNAPDPSPVSSRLSYGDTIFYLKNQNYVVSPNTTTPGTFSAFPDDLNIDPSTGKITISRRGKSNQSQTGLRYRINFTAATGEIDSTFIVLAGVTYQDQIYYSSQNQTTVSPILNAKKSASLPNGSFSADRDKLEIDPVTGQIDLKKTMQNGFFGGDPDNDDWREVTITYTTNDNTNNTTNSIDLIVYYYDSVSDIPSNVSAVMRAHQSLLLGIDPVTIPVTSAPPDQEINSLVSITKPRPPCIIIVGH